MIATGTYRRVTLALAAAVAVMLAAATVAEKLTGSNAIYTEWWFVCAMCLPLVTGAMWTVRCRLWRRKSLFLLHGALLLIVAGAFVTYFTGSRGYVRLREGESVSAYSDPSDGSERALPFSVELKRFEIEYYDGTRTPRDYVSVVDVGGEERRISMNRICRRDSYRLYQMSYDPDMRGTCLAVSRDPYGIAVTYAGYMLLAVAMVLLLAGRDGPFRRLLRSKAVRGLGVLALLSAPLGAAAETRLEAPVDTEKVASLLILHENRVASFETFAIDMTAAVTGRRSWDGYSAVEIVCGWIYAPEKWQYAPMIEVGDARVRELLGVGRRAAFLDMFDGQRNYRVAQLLEDERYAGDAGLREELMRLNDRLDLILRLQSGQALEMNPVRGEEGIEWRALSLGLYNDENIADLAERQREVLGDEAPAEWRMKAERVFNAVNRTGPCSYALLTAGIAAFAAMCAAVARRRPMRGKGACMALLAAGWVFLTALLALRGAVAGHVPMSNGYETMLFIAWLILTASLAAGRSHAIFLPFGLLFAGFALLVSTMSGMSPRISPLMPVLHSAWLCCHVSLMMASYALLGFIAINGVMTWAVVLASRDDVRAKTDDLAVYSRLLLYPAVFLLAAGIFTGAVWANVSWGSYWSWDPKETWALVTMAVYAIPLHTGFGNALRWQSYLSFAFVSVLMTYFGVNVFFGGMHSYGHTDVPTGMFVGMGAAVALLAAMCAAAFRRYNASGI